MWVFAKTSRTLIIPLFFNKWKRIVICFIALLVFYPIQQIEHLILNFLLSYTNGSWGCWLKTSFFATLFPKKLGVPLRPRLPGIPKNFLRGSWAQLPLHISYLWQVRLGQIKCREFHMILFYKIWYVDSKNIFVLADENVLCVQAKAIYPAWKM